MEIPPLIGIESALIGLVCNGILLVRAYHHLAALRLVKHDIIELGHQCLGVNQVEVDQFFIRYLNPLVPLNEVDETAHLDLVIDLPSRLFRVVVPFLAHEEDLGRAADAERFVKEKNHLAELQIVNFLETVALHIFSLDREDLALSVDTEYLVELFTVKA